MTLKVSLTGHRLGSRRTLTEIAWLGEAGADRVYPVVLADTSRAGT